MLSFFFFTTLTFDLQYWFEVKTTLPTIMLWVKFEPGFKLAIQGKEIHVHSRPMKFESLVRPGYAHVIFSVH